MTRFARLALQYFPTFPGAMTHTTSKTPSGKELNRLLSKLPQELYDEIYELVFTVAPRFRRVNKYYRPPSVLQVSPETREKFAKSYYGGNTTFLDHDGTSINECSVALLRDIEDFHIKHPKAVIKGDFGVGFVELREKYHLVDIVVNIMRMAQAEVGLRGCLWARANAHYNRREIQVVFEPEVSMLVKGSAREPDICVPRR